MNESERLKRKGRHMKKKIKKRKQRERERERERDEMTEFQGLQRKTDRMTDGVLK